MGQISCSNAISCPASFVYPCIIKSPILTECWRMMHHKIYASVFFSKTDYTCLYQFNLAALGQLSLHFVIVILILFNPVSVC